MENEDKKKYRLQIDEETGIIYLDSIPDDTKPVRSLKFFYSINPNAYQFHVVNEGLPYFVKTEFQNGRVRYRYCEIYIGLCDRTVIQLIEDDLIYHIPNAVFSLLIPAKSRFAEMVKLMYQFEVEIIEI